MIFAPPAKVLINKEDYMDLLLQFSGMFLYSTDKQLTKAERLFLIQVVYYLYNGKSIRSNSFLDHMVTNCGYANHQCVRNDRYKLKKKGWIFKKDDDLIVSKYLLDFCQQIDKGDQGLKLQFVMDYLPNLSKEEMVKSTHRLHPTSVVRLRELQRKDAKERKQLEREVLEQVKKERNVTQYEGVSP